MNLLSLTIEYLNEEHDGDFDNVVKIVRTLKGADRKRNRRISDAELGAIGEHISARGRAEIMAFFQFSLNQGTRRSEIFRLRWGDIDLARHSLILPRHKT